jgi:hypothetical protein
VLLRLRPLRLPPPARCALATANSSNAKKREKFICISLKSAKHATHELEDDLVVSPEHQLLMSAISWNNAHTWRIRF